MARRWRAFAAAESCCCGDLSLLGCLSGSTREWAEGKADMARVISSIIGFANVEAGKKRFRDARQSSALLRANSSVVLMFRGIGEVCEARERKRTRRVA